MIFPVFYTMKNKLAKIAFTLKSVGSFSASASMVNGDQVVLALKARLE
jgi:hypothetical protein